MQRVLRLVNNLRDNESLAYPFLVHLLIVIAIDYLPMCNEIKILTQYQTKEP